MFYTDSKIERFGEKRSDPKFISKRLAHPETVLLPVWKGQNLIQNFGDSLRAGSLTVAEANGLLSKYKTLVFLGEINRQTYFALDLSLCKNPESLQELSGRGKFRNLRDVGSEISQCEGALLAFGRGMFAWHEASGFCSRCGSLNQICDGGHRRQCVSCNISQYPRINPAVIMLICRGDKCLLGHNSRRPAKWFSCLAGFVEIGESLEEPLLPVVIFSCL